MIAFGPLRVVGLLLATLLSASAFAASTAALDEAMSHDGLQKVKSKDLDLVYVRPGATLAGYRKVRLDPVEVAFRKDWSPTRTGSLLPLSDEEREKIRAGVAKIVLEEFANELQRGGKYPVVAASGPDVLRVTARIIDLYVNAPDTRSAARARVYTVSAGEMTIVAELYDSETGQVIARVVDRREARSTDAMQLSSTVVNAAEAGNVAAAWARILRKSLDKAQEVGRR